jgi:hypothetical protein
MRKYSGIDFISTRGMAFCRLLNLKTTLNTKKGIKCEQFEELALQNKQETLKEHCATQNEP